MTAINADTKIAAILKKDSRALDALIAVTPKFEKLRNPLLRRLMAGRTSLRQAAKIGGCELMDIVEALKPLGFEYSGNGEEEEAETAAPAPDFMKEADESACTILDVRQDLAAGNDPLKKIMGVVKDLPPGKILKLVNTFEPTPLINLLEKKGYESYIKHVGADEVHAFFKQKGPGKQDLEEEGPEITAPGIFEAKLASFGERVTVVDVREMEMPMPMITILESMEELEDDHVLSVQHKRIPVFLFNELKERKYAYLLHKADDTDVRLLIWKNIE